MNVKLRNRRAVETGLKRFLVSAAPVFLPPPRGSLSAPLYQPPQP